MSRLRPFGHPFRPRCLWGGSRAACVDCRCQSFLCNIRSGESGRTPWTFKVTAMRQFPGRSRRQWAPVPRGAPVGRFYFGAAKADPCRG